ncbi:MAG: hypothetical protein J2P24_13015 [Streptosporangiales bacterium]|nr:hypothetical protein [Streptosporangiales bacterium]MBO0889488.1 hypothetical protein [Acidothermales bacterium]
MTFGQRVTAERTVTPRRSWPVLWQCATWPVLVAAASGPLAAAGLIAAAEVSWLLVLAVTAAGAVLSGGLTLVLARRRRTGRGRAGMLFGSLLAACWALAALVLLPLAAPWALAAGLLVGLASAWVVLAEARQRLRESRGAWRLPTAFAAVPRRYQRAVLRGRSAEQLCRMWDAAGREMGQVAHVDALSDYLELRRLLLAELERRDPAAFAKWLEHADAGHIWEWLVPGHRAQS